MGSIQWNRGKTCEVFLNRGSNGRVHVISWKRISSEITSLGPQVQWGAQHAIFWSGRDDLSLQALKKGRGSWFSIFGVIFSGGWKIPRSKYTKPGVFFRCFLGVYSDGVPPKFSWQSLSLVKGRGTKSLTWIGLKKDVRFALATG